MKDVLFVFGTRPEAIKLCPVIREMAATLTAGASSTCTVTLSKTGGATVTLSSNTALLTVPPSVSVPSGSTSATFTAAAGAIATGQTAVVTASFNGVARTASIVLQPTQSLLSMLTCSPDPSLSGTQQCTVQLSQAAPAGGTAVSIQASSSRLQPPAQVVIPSEQQSAVFMVGVLASDQDEQPQITATTTGAVQTASISIVGIRPTTLQLSNTAVSPGQWIDAVIDLTSPNVPEIARLTIASSTPDLQIPHTIVTRPGQTRVTFRTYIDPHAKQQSAAISVQFGQTLVKASLAVMAASAPILTVPAEVAVRFNEAASFTVSAVDSYGLPLVYSADNLPAGAAFDPTTGLFSWTPSASQSGLYDVAFTATNSAQAAAAAHVKIAVDSGAPVVTGVRNAATPKGPVCSPGALATVEGRWFTPQGAGVSDPAASVPELNGVRVKVYGDYVPLAYASRERIDFVCPAVDPGTPLALTVENSAGKANAVGGWTGTSAAIAPGLFSVNGSGSGQGMVYLAGTSLLATARDYNALGQPSQPGDSVSIRVTGIGDPANAQPTVTVGGMLATVQTVRSLPGVAGLAEITIIVPLGVQPGDSVPVVATFRPATASGSAQGRGSGNLRIRSNIVMIAVESGRQ